VANISGMLTDLTMTPLQMMTKISADEASDSEEEENGSNLTEGAEK